MSHTVTQLAKNVYSFPIPLPNNPLKWLNCYVVKGEAGERSLLIDTGFNREECRQALLGGMAELCLDPAEMDVFLTHLHSDHTGNAAELSRQGSRVIISRRDNAVLHSARWEGRMKMFCREGMPEDLVERVHASNPGMLYAPKFFDAVCVEDGDVLQYGGYKLRCIHTPGHTPGHMCLYDEAAGLLFLGDHVLFDISPNISVWNGFPDPVGTYMESLGKIMKLDAKLCLPAHRSLGTVSMAERAQQLIDHHRRRLDETAKLIGENPGITAYELAGLMTWRIRARNWEEFPPAQKNFALMETLAHIEHLVISGAVRRTEGESVNTYSLI